MNIHRLQDLVNGSYGRKRAYASVTEITEQNIIDVIGSCIGVFWMNRPVFEYLHSYKNGDQPIRYRQKTIRSDVNNPIVENHAWEIVRFKNAQTNGEPIQCTSARKDENINNAIDRFNDYCTVSGKHSKDITSGEWTSATGTGFKAVQRVFDSDVPFRIVVPSPMNTFIIYSSITEEPLLSVQVLKDKDNMQYMLCFSKTHEYVVQNSELVSVIDTNGNVVKSKPHGYGDIPIVEYPNNADMVSDIELVIDILDAINNMQSNRMDSIEQFVQSFVKFVNCDVDAETFRKMKTEGAFVVKSNNGDNKADVDIMSQELNQTQAQVAKEDLIENAWSILAIPSKQGNTGGDTQGAVELRNGWSLSKQAEKLKDPYTIDAERRLNRVIRTVIRQAKGDNECPFTDMDYTVQISHSPADNMQVKAQVYQMLVKNGIHPLIAIKTCGLWTDAEKVFLLSKPYIDVLYKTIDMIEDAEEQERMALELMNQNKNGGENT